MAVEDETAQVRPESPIRPSGVSGHDRKTQLVTAVEAGEPLILGEELPGWTPDKEAPPPAELVITAAVLRQVLLDQGLGANADPRGLTIWGAVIVGELDLDNASVSYPLSFYCCWFTDSVTARQASLHALRIDASHVAGAIGLPGTRIAGQLVMRGAKLDGTDSGGYSLYAESLQARDVVLYDGFTAEGAVQLVGARIGGALVMRGAKLASTDSSGYSLNADSLQARDVLLDDRFTTGGAVWLDHARISGKLWMRGAKLKDINGYSLHAINLQAGTVNLDGGFTATGVIGFVAADVGDLVVADDKAALPRLGAATGWRLRDLHGVVRTDRSAAAKWLGNQETAQPWQELAAVYERNGQPADARWMRYRSAVRSTSNTNGLTWLARQTYRWTTGHGYYPLAAVGWLLAIFFLAWALTATWAHEFTTPTTATIRADLTTRAEAAATGGAVEDPPIPGPPLPGRAPAAWCTEGWDVPCLSPPVYALSTAIPAASPTQPWTPPDDNGAPAVVFHLLRLSAWVFTALLLAGFTGLLRKQT